jgi:uncharacterized membrane protein
MIARFDHRPRLTALLVLSTIVLFVVVVMLATLLITAVPQAASSTSGTVGGNSIPGGGDTRHTAGEGGRGGPQGLGANVGVRSRATGNDSIDRHAEVVAAYTN